MMSSKIKNEEIELILNKNSKNKLKIIKSSISTLLRDGDNFSNDFFKINVSLIDDDDKEKNLNLIIKMYPSKLNIRKIFDFNVLFKKEIFFYEKLIPYYNEIELDSGIKNVFDIVPKYFGGKLSSDFNSTEVDENAMFLMENLATHGYYTLDKLSGLDLEHSKSAIKSLARFHALGIALKYKKPEVFEIIKNYATFPKVKISQEAQKNFLIQELINDSYINKYKEKIIEMMNCYDPDMILETKEPWNSIAHNDLWTKKILFHKNSNGHIDDIKFIDFQDYFYHSPLIDLPYLLCTSTEYNATDDNFEELLDLYYETFIFVLQQMKCDYKLFTRNNFIEQLKIDANEQFCHIVFSIWYFCSEIDVKNPEDENLLNKSFPEITDLCRKKWLDLVNLYVRKNWI